MHNPVRDLMWVEKDAPPETLRPVGTRYQSKVEFANEFCTYGAMVGMKDSVFYPHLMPKGIGKVSGQELDVGWYVCGCVEKTLTGPSDADQVWGCTEVAATVWIRCDSRFAQAKRGRGAAPFAIWLMVTLFPGLHTKLLPTLHAKVGNY